MSSNQQSSSSFTSSSFSSMSYSSSSSSNINGQQSVSGSRHSQTSYTGPDGTTRTVTQDQNLGEPVVRTERAFDSQGRETIGAAPGNDGARRIEDVTDQEQAKRDREYEERIEEEYAKREGGA